MRPLRIAMFGSSLLSAFWNGAATYYRGIVKALHERGHEITFFEADVYDRQKHRDLTEPPWAHVVVYDPTDSVAIHQTIMHARHYNLVIKCSNTGALDEFLESEIAALHDRGPLTAFWDVDAPATLERLMTNHRDALRPLISEYDIVFTYGGGDSVVERYRALGARLCVPVYNALDPDTHFRVPIDRRYQADLGFQGHRLPDREARVQEFFFQPASKLPSKAFLIGGEGWSGVPSPSNVTYCGHVYTRDHNAFNSSVLAVLNVNRESMAECGFSPPTRIFEAAGAAACIISDAWVGIDQFLEPGKEVLVAASGEEVLELLQKLTPSVARQIGELCRQRILAHHTYRHRAELVERVLDMMLQG